MCKNYGNLEFTHFVVATDGTIFGSARENGNIYNFLIQDGAILCQEQEEWVDLEPACAEIIRARAQAAYTRVPTYHTDRFIFN